MCTTTMTFPWRNFNYVQVAHFSFAQWSSNEMNESIVHPQTRSGFVQEPPFLSTKEHDIKREWSKWRQRGKNNKLSKIIVESRTRVGSGKSATSRLMWKFHRRIFRLSVRAETILWFDCCLAAFSALLSKTKTRSFIHGTQKTAK